MPILSSTSETFVAGTDAPVSPSRHEVVNTVKDKRSKEIFIEIQN